jgi:hypothetical protein
MLPRHKRATVITFRTLIHKAAPLMEEKEVFSGILRAHSTAAADF